MNLTLERIDALGPPLLQLYAGRAGQAECNLGIGQLADDPPGIVKRIISAAMAVTKYAHYTPAGGRADVLAVVAEVFQNLGIAATAETVVISHGAKLLLDVAMRATCRGRVFWFAPGYTFERMARLDGLSATKIDVRQEFLPDIKEAGSILETTSRPGDVMIINSPTNPTGRLWPRHTLEDLVILAKRFDLTIISDETYGDLIYGGTFISVATLQGVAERTITIRSASKEMRIPGLRLGYTCGPKSMIDAMKVILGDCVGCPNTLTQAIAKKMLPRHREFAEEQILALRGKKEVVVDWCTKLGLPLAPIDGAFYAFMDFSRFIKSKGLRDATKLADNLLKDCGVGIIPGAAFDSMMSETWSNWARISFAGNQAELEGGLSRIGQYLQS